MKQFFSRPQVLMMALAFGSVAFFSCNNEGSSDSKEDTLAPTISSGDTAHKMDSSHVMATDTTPAPLVAHAEAALSGTKADTSLTGIAKFDTAANGKVKLEIEITVPQKANSSVAVHLHEHGDCGESGNMAHGHWNPTKAQHGKWGADSFHLGDIGNIKLDGKGKGKISLSTDLWTLGGPVSSNVLGRAVIVHSGVDDFKTQPTGNAGSRIGCGVIK